MKSGLLCNAYPFSFQPVAADNTAQPEAERDTGYFFQLELLPAEKTKTGSIKVGSNNTYRRFGCLAVYIIEGCIIQ